MEIFIGQDLIACPHYGKGTQENSHLTEHIMASKKLEFVSKEEAESGYGINLWQSLPRSRWVVLLQGDFMSRQSDAGESGWISDGG